MPTTPSSPPPPPPPAAEGPATPPAKVDSALIDLVEAEAFATEWALPDDTAAGRVARAAGAVTVTS